jgi:hypothetical protein
LTQPLDSAPNTYRPQAGFAVYDGELILPSFVTNSATPNETFIHALPARSAALTLTQASPFRGGNIVLGGDGALVVEHPRLRGQHRGSLLHAAVNTLQVAGGALYSSACLGRDGRVSDIDGMGALLKTRNGIWRCAACPGHRLLRLSRTDVIRAGKRSHPGRQTIRPATASTRPGPGFPSPILLGGRAQPARVTIRSLELAGGASLVAHDITVAGHAVRAGRARA